MNTKAILSVVAVIVLVGAGWWAYTQYKPVPAMEMAQSSDMGTYGYQCDNGVQFSMTLTQTDDGLLATIAPSTAAPFSTTTLKEVGQSTFATAEGEVTFVGAGEEVTLTVGAATMHCNPVPSSDMAPFNWGDATQAAQ